MLQAVERISDAAMEVVDTAQHERAAQITLAAQ
jgi:hypothetical protein